MVLSKKALGEIMPGCLGYFISVFYYVFSVFVLLLSHQDWCKSKVGGYINRANKSFNYICRIGLAEGEDDHRKMSSLSLNHNLNQDLKANLLCKLINSSLEGLTVVSQL